MEDYIYRQFCSFLGEDKVKREEPMGKHTTFRIGGPADLFCSPRPAISFVRTPRKR